MVFAVGAFLAARHSRAAKDRKGDDAAWLFVAPCLCAAAAVVAAPLPQWTRGRSAAFLRPRVCARNFCAFFGGGWLRPGGA